MTDKYFINYLNESITTWNYLLKALSFDDAIKPFIRGQIAAYENVLENYNKFCEIDKHD